MADKKISQLTAKGSKIASTDRVPIAQDNGGGTFATKYVTGAEINEVKLDTSPQLGGNLDVNGYQITSDNDQDVVINPNGVGIVKIESNLHLRDTAGGTAKQINLYEGFSNGSNYIGIKAPDSLSTDTTYTLPTADGASGQVLSTNGTGTLSWATAGGGITVGTTAIASGTIGRVFFEGSGNVLQQSANLFWDNTNNALGLGASPLSTSRLDIRAKDGLSTSQSLRIRNNTDNATQFEVSGNGLTTINGNITASSAIARAINITSTLNAAANNDVLVGCDVSPIFTLGAFTGTTSLSGRFTGRFRIVNGILDVWDTRSDSQNRNWSIIPNSQVFGDLNIATSNANGGNPQTAGTSRIYISPTGDVGIGGVSFGTNAAKVFAQYNGTAPGSSPADAFQMYSADVVAGNAAPHIRTENGNIVKIYQETTAVAAATLVSNAGTNITDTDTFDGYTLKQIVKALRNLGILA